MCCWLVCNQLNKERKKELRIETDGRNMTSPPPIHTKKKKNKRQTNCVSPDRGDVMGGGETNSRNDLRSSEFFNFDYFLFRTIFYVRWEISFVTVAALACNKKFSPPPPKRKKKKTRKSYVCLNCSLSPFFFFGSLIALFCSTCFC